MSGQGWSLDRASAFLGSPGPVARRILGAAGVTVDGAGDYQAVDVAACSESMRLRDWWGRRDWTSDYQREGFTLLRGQVDPDTLFRIVEASYRAASVADGGHAEVVYGDSGKIVRINGLERDPAVLPIVRTMRLETVAAGLIDAPVLYRVSLVRRGHGNPPELGAHRDPRWTTRRSCDPVCAFGMTLDGSTGEPGDVYYQPGTHRLGPGSKAAPAIRSPDSEVLPVTSPGDVVLHNLGVIHGAGRYVRRRDRTTLYCSFASQKELSAR
ncbi:MAG: hypothetical protein JWM19_5304 [Actinomycetia bacterium]|nr:hypothetical protein [Actinomycetes bacterium]